MRYSSYGTFGGISHKSLLELAKKKCLWARAENSGSEGCYCEIARWNEKSEAWERYCFEKFFGNDKETCWEEASRYADEINAVAGTDAISVIHRLPNYSGE
jgi:hypothetical protein